MRFNLLIIYVRALTKMRILCNHQFVTSENIYLLKKMQILSLRNITVINNQSLFFHGFIFFPIICSKRHNGKAITIL